MNELTIKQKAEAYDKAIEKLRDFYRDYDTVSLLINVKEELANIFPELKESEDEKIRGAIIHFISHTPTVPKGIIGKETMLAWLEKQGEQKPAEWSEEDEKILSDIIKDLVHPWNEYIPDRIEDEIKWLKNRLKSPRPQPKQEWSEEGDDDAWLNDIISKAECNLQLNKDEIDWLKSLSPKNRWKPSDEMLEALDIAIRAGIQLGTWEETSLRELQKQLKKLREE